MRILIVGAGAVGSYFGGRLIQGRRDVTFLVHARRAESIRKEGLRILSPHGNVALQPKVLLSEQIDTTFDLILLSVKAYSLKAAMNDFARAVGQDTVILPVLNGMSHIEVLAAQFGEKKVIGGVCLVATEVDNEGRIVQLSDVQSLIYGERAGGSSDRIRALDGVLQGSGFDARISEIITQEMWEKWVQLSSLGAVTCLLRGNIGEIAAAPGGAEISTQTLDECTAIAAAYGYPPRDEFLARIRPAMIAKASSMTSSMYRDLVKGSPVEADQILGDLLALARANGVPAPLLQAAFVNLSIYQSRATKS